MLIQVENRVLNWTDQHLYVNEKEKKYSLDLWENRGDSGYVIKVFNSFEEAFEQMEYLARTKAVADKTPFIKIPETNG